MTHEEKIQKMYDEFPQRGISKSLYAPPLYKLLWRLGIKTTPPIFSSFVKVFITQASFFTVVWSILMCLILWRKQNMTTAFVVWIACFTGILYGLIMAALIKWQAKKYNLPSWKDYENS